MDNDLFDYFIEQTNRRFDKIEEKLDQLITFRLMLLGGAATLSAVVSFLVAIFLK
jgi:hypothetical protein